MEEGDHQARVVEALGTDCPPAKIQKVIFLLQDHKHFVKYFEPRVASVGPIHHGKPKYQLGEKYKLRLAYEFVKGCRKNINVLYELVEKNIKQLRECFEEEEVTKKYDDEALDWILFVDGCAILQYILCAVAPTQDLTANNKFTELNIKNDSVVFAHQDLFLLENQVPYHLLKLLMSSSGKEGDLRKSIESFIRNKDKSKDDTDPQLYRNVQELKAAGIQLKRSKNSYLRNISFRRRLNFYPGFLCLPPIIVDDSTGPKFMHLIAYEMCLDFKNDFGISSYIFFLDSLIDEANDVKDLRKARVLHNFLGNDQEVAELFNEIGTDLVPKRRNISPWSILAFIGVLLALILSLTQTWYAAHPPPGPCDDFCKIFP
ncbi:hypothetical protein FH972_016710 [Carpinus fangiana]|uniref:Uncharacterized protein n=1 Tax=Carpinus fangiana TaxID=176857 RepID=A0A5N6RK14_9ROSI|nr:hypothetical protein FH972_016710 [Carpinus fangiana]